MVSATNTGRAGEHLVAHLLILRGCHVSIVDSEGVDLWVMTPAGDTINIEVKSAYPRAPEAGLNRSIRYAFTLHNTVKAEYMAFVALDLGLFLLRRPLAKNAKQCAIPRRHFTPEAMEETINAHLLLKPPS